MNFHEAIRKMRDMSGISFSTASKGMGRSSQYLSVVLQNGGSPRIDTCEAIAASFGFELIVDGDNIRFAISKYPGANTIENSVTPKNALRKLVGCSRKSNYEISKRMGKSSAYIASLLDKDSIPTISTFVSVAEACDCKVVLRGHGRVFRLNSNEAAPVKSSAKQENMNSYEDYYSQLLEKENPPIAPDKKAESKPVAPSMNSAQPTIAPATINAPESMNALNTPQPTIEAATSKTILPNAAPTINVQSISQNANMGRTATREWPMTADERKLSDFKDRLLDLSMRNNMLNYKDRKTGTLHIQEPEIAQFYQHLVLNEKPMTFIDSSPDDESLYRTKSTPSSFLVTEKTKAELIRSLRRLDSVARASIDEQGINILYLAFGMLHWIDPNQKDHIAPLVMVPVRLTKTSARSNYILQADDDDPVFNPTLAYYLEQTFGIVLPPMEKAEKLMEYLTTIANAVQVKQGWEITSDVVLSTFQFQKLSMYHDLESRAYDILSHPVVKAIMGDREDLKEFKGTKNPDEYSPYDTYQVVDADASQQQAILAAHSGESFVLQGPPGTGKSQTITNIIADCLGSGKTVLFVSEKKAALDVVHRRLTQAGLQDFCLVLHSNKAGKKEVLGQLESTLKLYGKPTRIGSSVSTRLHTMVQLRDDLNKYASEVYKPLQPLDRSPYEVIGLVADFSSREIPWITCIIDNIETIDQQKLAEMVDSVRAYGLALESLGCAPDENPWNRLEISRLEYGESEGVLQSVSQISATAQKLAELNRQEVEALGIKVSPTLESVEASLQLLDDIAATPQIPSYLATSGVKSSTRIIAAWKEKRAQIDQTKDEILKELGILSQMDNELIARVDGSFLKSSESARMLASDLASRMDNHSYYAAWNQNPEREINKAIKALKEAASDYHTYREAILTDYHPEILDIEFLEMESRFKNDYKSIFKRLGGQHRNDISALSTLRKSSSGVDDEEAARILNRLHTLSNKQRAIEESSDHYEKLLGSGYRGVKTDFDFISAKRNAFAQAQTVLKLLDTHIESLSSFEEDNESLSAKLHGIYDLNNPEWTESASQAISSLEGLLDSYGIGYKGVALGSVLEQLEDPQTANAAAELASAIRGCLSGSKAALNDVAPRIEAGNIRTVNLERLSSAINKAIPTGPLSLEASAAFTKAKNACTSNGLTSFLSSLSKEANALDSDFINLYDEIFLHSFYRLWLGAVAWKQRPSLSSFNAKEQTRRINRFAEIDSEQLSIDRARVQEILVPKIPSPAAKARGKDEMSILVRELNKKTRIRPIRKLFADIPNVILALKPCLMMSPLSVSTYLESASFKFDTVIFDEASQVRTEDALGVISRGKQIIIAGDSKQLPPTNFFAKTIESDDDEDESEEYYEQAGSFDSVLDEAALLNPISLKWHYRSRNESLIAFSNNEIYDGELYTFPSSQVSGKDSGVEFEFVQDGVYEGSRKGNRIEASRVVDLVFRHFATYGTSRSLGVIALGENQSRIIESELLKRRIANPDTERFFDTGLEEPFFVKNLENVQGDERDTIILSVGYAKGPTGKLSHNFGPINVEGGERRLNVAVTRARINLKLVSSVDPSEINAEHVTNIGPKMLKDYLSYAKMGSDGIAGSSYREFGYFTEDLFVKTILQILDDEGYEVDKNVGQSGCRIDLGVRHPDYPDCYCMGIICDGDSYHAATTARDRDRLRTEVLQGMGWRLYHIWSCEWIKDQETQREALLEAVKEAVATFEPPEEVEGQEPLKESESINTAAEPDTASYVYEDSQDIVDDEPEFVEEDSAPAPVYASPRRNPDGTHLYDFQSFAEFQQPDRDVVSDIGALKQLIYTQAPFSVEYFLKKYRDMLYPSGTSMSYALKQSGMGYLQNKLKDLIVIKREHNQNYVFRRDQRTILPRVAGSRSIDDISTSELRAGVKAVMLGYEGEPTRQSLISETAAAFEFGQYSQTIEDRIGEAIDDLQTNRELRYVDGHYELVKKGSPNG